MTYLVIFSFFILLAMTIFSWSKNKNIIFLSLLLTSINMWAILHYWLVIDFDGNMAAVFSNHFTPIYLMIGPFLYFYVRGVIEDDFLWKKTDLIHLIPATLQLALILPYTFGYSHEEKINLLLEIHNNPSDYLNTYFNPIFNALQTGVIRIFSVTVYLTYSTYLLIKYVLNFKNNILLNIQRHIVLRWLMYLHVSLFIILGLYVYLLYRSNSAYNFALTSQSYAVHNGLAFLISINNLSLFLIPEIMFGLIIPKKTSSLVNHSPETNNRDLQVIGLKDIEYLSDISDRIDTIMELNKPFLRKDFKLVHLANSLNVPEHHLASCLRNIREITFTDLKNSSRINTFKDRIENGALDNLTIDALREECGFQSKSSFYSAFQKHEGMNPMEYLSKNSSVY